MTSTGGKRPEPLYIAVIGDLVDSRNLPDRAEVQRRLVEALGRYNEEAKASIASRFLVTLGDEFQGLLKASAGASDFWWFFQEHIGREASTRLGFGLGPLTTDLEEEALGMDGPCFHAARAAIELTRAEKVRFAFGVSSCEEVTGILNRISRPLERITESWSDVQWRTVLGLHHGRSLTAIAAARRVSPQSVSKTALASYGVESLEAWRGIDDLLRLSAQSRMSPAGEGPPSIDGGR